eukprot:2586870-Rhodomonas_salina.3
MSGCVVEGPFIWCTDARPGLELPSISPRVSLLRSLVFFIAVWSSSSAIAGFRHVQCLVLLAGCDICLCRRAAMSACADRRCAGKVEARNNSFPGALTL